MVFRLSSSEWSAIGIKAVGNTDEIASWIDIDIESVAIAIDLFFEVTLTMEVFPGCTGSETVLLLEKGVVNLQNDKSRNLSVEIHLVSLVVLLSVEKWNQEEELRVVSTFVETADFVVFDSEREVEEEVVVRS